MHNRTFLSKVPDDYCDWMVTVAFYAAVHAVEALFAFDKLQNHSSHASRNRTLKNVNRYKNICKYFLPLYNASQTTRYLCSPTDWIPVNMVKKQFIEINLYGLERSVLKLMQDSTELDKLQYAD